MTLAQKPGRPTRVGLTGGVGSGKSTVARLLAARGIPVIDTDRVGHELLADPRGRVYRAVVERFGAGVLNEEGVIERARLASVVFACGCSKADLEEILHPAISAEVERRVAALPPGTPLVVLEVPLLLEAGWDRRVDFVVVVDCPPEVQVARFQARTGAPAEDGWARIRSQLPRAERLARADFVIDNSGPMEELEGAVEKVLRKIRESGGFHGR